MHEMHPIEVALREVAKEISRERGDAPVVIVVAGDQEKDIGWCMTGSSLHNKGDRLRHLLGLLEAAEQGEHTEALEEEATKLTGREINGKSWLHGASVIVIVGDGKSTLVGSNFYVDGSRDLLGIIESAKQIESTKHFWPRTPVNWSAWRWPPWKDVDSPESPEEGR